MKKGFGTLQKQWITHTHTGVNTHIYTPRARWIAQGPYYEVTMIRMSSLVRVTQPSHAEHTFTHTTRIQLQQPYCMYVALVAKD